jgi:hypothetical protein
MPLVFAVAALLIFSVPACAQVVVDITPGHQSNTYSPVKDLGAGVDGQLVSIFDEMWSQSNEDQMLQAGWQPVSYRLYTELSVQHWHWNPQGAWSDPAQQQGYWVSRATGSGNIHDSYGYRLPHRGFTGDQGNNDDYSRLDDGDLTTYWKSNPYLSSAWTGESDSLHPAWIVVDLGNKQPVDAIQLYWANPYAISYQVQYWTGDDAIYDPAHGSWVNFPNGVIVNATGGTVTLQLAAAPKHVEYVRVLMTTSSYTCDSHGTGDPRNCAGYAVYEMGLGTMANGKFTDLMTHVPNNTQTATYVSSVDPWHTAANRVLNQEQPGLDFIFTNGITQGLPTTVPVGMLYGVPQDAAAEISYLERQGYPIARVEMGEEPDGQFMTPEDYGALYLQWARALHAVDPSLKLGGPVFQGVSPVTPNNDVDVPVWADAAGNVSWLKRFLKYLTAHGALAELSFFSFETYPFSLCGGTQTSLLQTPGSMENLLKTWAKDGLPSGLPVLVTEYNVSFDSPAAFQDIDGALIHADMAGSLLTGGANGLFYYEYEPTRLGEASGCDQYGALGMFKASNSGDQIQYPTSQYFSTQLLTQQWSQPVDAVHTLYPAKSAVKDAKGNVLVTAYAVLRPDGQYALMLINKDHASAYQLRVTFQDHASGLNHYFSGPVETVVFGKKQYYWHANGVNGYPDPDGPPETSSVAGGKGTEYTIPPASIVILRGQVQ